jgi:hypothetical protein
MTKEVDWGKSISSLTNRLGKSVKGPRDAAISLVTYPSAFLIETNYDLVAGADPTLVGD